MRDSERDDPREAPGRDGPPERLAQAVAACAGPVFAVVDGGHFDDLPARLREAGIFARSLFLDHADRAVERAGPFLVTLDERSEARERLLAVIGDRPALVVWTCDAGGEALFRHLRTLNMARIPAWAAQGGSGAPPGEEESRTRAYETVMFRHWDPRVLAALLPALDAAQFRRMLGPASGMIYHCADYGGLKRVVADPAWPPAPAGLLTIHPDQIAVLQQRRSEAADRALAGYLRQVAPENTAGLNEAALREKVLAYRASAQRVGLIEEPTIAQWAYLMVSTDGTFERQPRVRAYLLRGPSTPDRNLDTLVAEMRRLAEADGPAAR